MDLSELDRLEKQVGTIRLSEAIRIGIRRFPKASIAWHVGNDHACILGCIDYAVSGRTAFNPAMFRAIEEYFGICFNELHELHKEYLADGNLSRERIANALERVGL